MPESQLQSIIDVYQSTEREDGHACPIYVLSLSWCFMGSGFWDPLTPSKQGTLP